MLKMERVLLVEANDILAVISLVFEGLNTGCFKRQSTRHKQKYIETCFSNMSNGESDKVNIENNLQYMTKGYC